MASPALHTDESGTIRVGQSRVTLDVVLADHKRGLSPEEIVHQLDTLNLADVKEAIAYFHRNRDEVEQYLTRRRAEAEALRREIEATQSDHTDLLTRLQNANGTGGHASSAQ